MNQSQAPTVSVRLRATWRLRHRLRHQPVTLLVVSGAQCLPARSGSWPLDLLQRSRASVGLRPLAPLKHSEALVGQALLRAL